jgi:hypothetical protein
MKMGILIRLISAFRNGNSDPNRIPSINRQQKTWSSGSPALRSLERKVMCLVISQTGSVAISIWDFLPLIATQPASFPRSTIRFSHLSNHQNTTMAEELRIAIRYNTLNVPSLPNHRAEHVANDFAIWKLSRRFDHDRDFIHRPSDFDSSAAKSVWILCDFNVRHPRPDLNHIPMEFWKVTYGNKNNGNENQQA